MDWARSDAATLFYLLGLVAVDRFVRRCEQAAALAAIEQATYDREFWALVGDG